MGEIGGYEAMKQAFTTPKSGSVNTPLVQGVPPVMVLLVQLPSAPKYTVFVPLKLHRAFSGPQYVVVTPLGPAVTGPA